jgi:hypothetical protein
LVLRGLAGYAVTVEPSGIRYGLELPGKAPAR